MLDTLIVRNFQSLKNVHLTLDKFTVIVGPSSSGKSALMRALRVLASNSRGAAYVHHGEKVAAVQAGTQDWAITIERGEGHGVYALTERGQEQRFTKLGGGVPEEITARLGIDPVPTDGSSINFAGQFDRPYLLDDSGAQVARTLGELTNVNVLFEASREANRRRLAASTTLKTRQGDLAQLQEQAQAYRGLGDRLAALDEAESAAATAADLKAKIDRLRDSLTNIEVAEGALDRLKAKAAVEVPDYGPVETAYNRLGEFRATITELTLANRKIAVQAAEIEKASALEASLQEQFHQVLHDAGRCPTCGQDTTEGTSL